MLSKTELWDLIEPVVQEQSLTLFDIDLPSGRGGILRITVAAGEGASDGVGIDDCTKVSKRISALDRFEEVIPPRVTLEVSSPGVNRRLRRPEHFQGAIGEHIKLKVYDRERNEKENLVGVLLDFNGTSLQFEADNSGEQRTIPFEDVSDARVDFIFD